LFACAEHLPQPRLQEYFCRTPAAPVQPVFKILNFDDMRNVGMPDLHGNGGQSSPDLADPSVTAQRSEGVAEASYRNSAVTSIACAISSMSWITTVQALRATRAIYHIRYLFAYFDFEKVRGEEGTWWSA
jgi:hypothetical protein